MSESNDATAELVALQQELDRTRGALRLLYQIGNLFRDTLELRPMLYRVLTGITAGEGLGLNRAAVFLATNDRLGLSGAMGIGPDSLADANGIWQAIATNPHSLESLAEEYEHFLTRESRFDEMVRACTVSAEGADPVAKAFRTSRPVSHAAGADASGWPEPLRSLVDLEGFVAVPLGRPDRPSGVLYADNLFTRVAISSETVGALRMLCHHAGLAVENALLFEQTWTSSRTDSLTRLWNHGHFWETLEREVERCLAKGGALGLILGDLDDFKVVNDTHGHLMGDHVLAAAADRIRSMARSHDVACRYGGEEFAVILPGANRETGLRVGERLVDGFRRPVEISGTSQRVTLSAGVASLPEDAQSAKELVDAADRALLKAKGSGRNRVVSAASAR